MKGKRTGHPEYVETTCGVKQTEMEEKTALEYKYKELESKVTDGGKCRDRAQ